MRRALLLAGLAVALAVPASAAAARPATWNTTPVGHLGFAGGFNGDVWVHKSVAYVGGWGLPGHCPVTGVKAIAVGRPSRPFLLARFARFPGTTSEDVWIGRVDTPSFHGDLAAVGIQRCRWEANGFRGLTLFDVTKASRPRLLGRLRFGSATRGVHELSVAVRADGRVLAFLSAPYAWNNSDGTAGDVRIADITNPRAPVQLADWDMRRDGPVAERIALRRSRGTEQLLAHSVAPFDNGRKVFVSHWDAGEVFLDIADPRHPHYLGRTKFTSGEYGNAHSAQFSPSGLFVENDEVGDFFHNHNEHGVWGTQRVFDASDPAHPVRLGRVATEHSIRGRDGRIGRDGIYSVHNNVFVGETLEVASWYSDGVRLFSLANPARPKQVGYFVPPPVADPQGYMRAPDGTRRIPLVWGVVVRGNLVYASDMNSGLWIFRAKALGS